MKKSLQLIIFGFILTWLIVPSYYFLEIDIKYLLLKKLLRNIAMILIYISFIGVIILLLSIVLFIVIFIKNMSFDVSRETL